MGRLRRTLALASAATTLTASAGARAAQLGPDGRLAFDPGALATFGFETGAELVGASAATLSWKGKGALSTTVVAASEADALVVPSSDALEGSAALRVPIAGAVGLRLAAPATFAAVASQRVEITAWARALGANPVLSVIYGPSDASVGPWSFARVVAVRTGRETSDGWAEYSTGPIDGSVWGFPIRALEITSLHASSRGATMLTAWDYDPTSAGVAKLAEADGYGLIDAIEIRPAKGAPLAATSCTMGTVDAACGDGGECLFGHCVDGVFSWGAVPSPAQAQEIVDRALFVEGRLAGDRKAAAAGLGAYAAVASGLVGKTGARAFWGGLAAATAGLRDAHTTMGEPYPALTLFYPYATNRSGPLDACFGVVTDDLSGKGGQGYAVFATYPNASLGKLQKGDLVVEIDGAAPDAWLDAHWPRVTTNIPNDPLSDRSHRALDLASLLGRRAKTVKLVRCTGPGQCAELPILDVGDTMYQLATSTGGYTGDSAVCSTRFHPSVSKPAAAYSDDVVVEKGPDGVTNVQFDGFDAASAAAMAAFNSAFAAPGPLLFDTRVGWGGKFVLGQWLYWQLRGKSDPSAMFFMPRGTIEDPDPPWVFDASWDGCSDPAKMPSWACSWSVSWTTLPLVDKPPAAQSKLAWVLGWDMSMNDIVPRALAGRGGFRTFGPHPTAGAYGQTTEVAPLMASFRQGSVQILDGRFGASLAGAKAAPWESGKGVAPDQVVVQTLSDVLANKDTLLDAARGWLLQ